ncbi:MAG: type II secretion system F family protein [Thermodesulfobacteriota bacterium]
MPYFKCRLGTEDKNIIEQVFEAETRLELLSRLKEKGYFVFNMRRLFWPFGSSARSASSWKTRDFIVFNQQVMTLLRSGVSLNTALEAMVEQEEKGKFKEVFKGLKKNIETGASFSTALESYPRLFPPLYVSTLRAGEGTGNLVQAMERYIGYLKNIQEAKRKIFSAAFYPLVLTGVLLSVVLFLFTYVVPKFSQIYASAGADLPWATRILISFTAVFTRHLPIIFLGFVLLTAGLYYYCRTKPGRRHLDAFKLRLPFAGEVLRQYLLSVFCRALSTLLAAGIPLVPSLRMSFDVFTNNILRERMVLATKKVEEGVNLTDAVSSAGIFPPLALRMIRVGESTGTLPFILNEIAEHYEAEVDVRLQIMAKVIEPALMVVMGLIVSGIVIAMYLPIFSLAGTVY